MLGAISVILSTSYIVKGTLLFVSFTIEVGYCREVEPAPELQILAILILVRHFEFSCLFPVSCSLFPKTQDWSASSK